MCPNNGRKRNGTYIMTCQQVFWENISGNSGLCIKHFLPQMHSCQEFQPFFPPTLPIWSHFTLNVIQIGLSLSMSCQCLNSAFCLLSVTRRATKTLLQYPLSRHSFYMDILPEDIGDLKELKVETFEERVRPLKHFSTHCWFSHSANFPHVSGRTCQFLQTGFNKTDSAAATTNHYSKICQAQTSECVGLGHLSCLVVWQDYVQNRRGVYLLTALGFFRKSLWNYMSRSTGFHWQVWVCFILVNLSHNANMPKIILAEYMRKEGKTANFLAARWQSDQQGSPLGFSSHLDAKPFRPSAQTWSQLWMDPRAFLLKNTFLANKFQWECMQYLGVKNLRFCPVNHNPGSTPVPFFMGKHQPLSLTCCWEKHARHLCSKAGA